MAGRGRPRHRSRRRRRRSRWPPQRDNWQRQQQQRPQSGQQPPQAAAPWSRPASRATNQQLWNMWMCSSRSRGPCRPGSPGGTPAQKSTKSPEKYLRVLSTHEKPLRTAHGTLPVGMSCAPPVIIAYYSLLSPSKRGRSPALPLATACGRRRGRPVAYPPNRPEPSGGIP